ncbi:hypothetical protein LQK89_02660 [Curtobacterium sp. C1]|uniref:hypothetical protein n=1 Tax=Curtobacterium sp. C1 TaxID=2898151 RepID=UPI001E547922|nr:hypothetical protein [Curtobacterium sp. C1]UFU14620.1 hypothetical protein LQK89_02660 [Curtobacterium sp. C1]
MKISEVDALVDHIAALPSRSAWTISEAVQAVFVGNGDSLHREVRRNLLGSAVPLVRTAERIMYADIDVNFASESEATNERSLRGTATIVTDDLLIALQMSAESGPDAYIVAQNVDSSAIAVRRSDIRKVTFEGVRTQPTDAAESEWRPNGSVTLHMREGEPIKLEAFHGAPFADLGNLLSL